MRIRCRRRVLLGSLMLSSSCISSAHFDTAIWGDAIAAQTRSPDQLLLQLGLLEATAAFAAKDRAMIEEATEDQSITEGKTIRGDAVDAGLALAATGIGIGDLSAGDHGHSLEVLGESFLVTEGITEGLKYAIGRERPSKDSHESFPSGHTSFAFAMATFAQRRIADLDPSWTGTLGYLAYLPAAYVGMNRVEANRHWPSDVAFGAFLGVFLTAVIYDAHYGTRTSRGLFGVHGLALEPELGADGAGIALALHF